VTAGLEHGAVDLRLTPEGEYIFLEVNQAGQFLSRGRRAKPIAKARAEHLVRGVSTSIEVE
jgi:D-alanine-D-alanine ligase-like ATP-grasp enzyme